MKKLIKIIPPRKDINLLLYFALILFVVLSIGLGFQLYFTSDNFVNNVFSQNYNNDDYSLLFNKSIKMYNKTLFNLSIGEFQYLIMENYKWVKYTRDCKYWAYIYYKFFENKGFEVKYHLTNKHIVTIATNDKGYYVLEGKNWKRYELG